MAYKDALKRFIPESLVTATRPLRVYFTPQRRFDRRFGVDTSGFIEPEDLGTPEATPEETGGYEPTPRAAFHRILKSLDLDYRRYTFVDMGSGKGAVLLYAAEFPFKEIVGIEFSPAMHAIAKKNLAVYRGRRVCGDIRNLLMNAVDFEPPAGPTVFFFFNPFKGRTLETVSAHIARAFAASPRDLLVIYYHTESRHPAFDRTEGLETVRRASDHTLYRARGGAATIPIRAHTPDNGQHRDKME
jgi:SAM-dependent methyltransferase